MKTWVIVLILVALIVGAVLMDYWNYKLAKAGGLIKRGGVFENIPANVTTKV